MTGPEVYRDEEPKIVFRDLSYAREKIFFENLRTSFRFYLYGRSSSIPKLDHEGQEGLRFGGQLLANLFEADMANISTILYLLDEDEGYSRLPGVISVTAGCLAEGLLEGGNRELANQTLARFVSDPEIATKVSEYMEAISNRVTPREPYL